MRIRTIKPEFWKHEQLAELTPFARLLFIGLWGLADIAGRLEDRPKRIKVEVLPYDDVGVDTLLDELARGQFIHRYEADGVRVIQIPHFRKHQRITGSEADTATEFPEPHEGNTKETPRKHDGSTLDDRKGREGKGEGRDGKGILSDASPPLLALEGEQQMPIKPATGLEAEFEAFWKAYPPVRKDGKGKAREAYLKACSKASPVSINAAVTLYRQCFDHWRQDDQKFNPLPASWLNSERFADDPETWRRKCVDRATYDDSGAIH